MVVLTVANWWPEQQQVVEAVRQYLPVHMKTNKGFYLYHVVITGKIMAQVGARQWNIPIPTILPLAMTRDLIPWALAKISAPSATEPARLTGKPALTVLGTELSLKVSLGPERLCFGQ
jgi:hypothetical protein